ncbi:MAG: hypothetical protein Q8Q42_03415 [Nanoarchaeota archaeon]|nr:hypothetical protein [Nanoarchaeota archaeon]
MVDIGNFLKKGEEGQPAAYLVMMIALFLIIYAIILPSSEKEAIYNDQPGNAVFPAGNSMNYGGTYGGGKPLMNFFSDSPGYMKPFFNEVFQKSLASINLYSVEQQGFETLANNIQLENGDKVDFVFRVDNLNELQDAQLLFFVAGGDGELNVKLNGISILSGEVTSEMLPINLPKSMIGEMNRLTFEANSSGFFGIFSNNGYLLKDVIVARNYVTRNNYEIRQFVLSSQEYYNLNHMAMYFMLNCFRDENGRLAIRLNGNLIHDALTVCDAGVTEVDFAYGDLIEGRNVLEFLVDRGQYILENVVIEVDFSQAGYYKEYFTLNSADYQLLNAGANIILQARFLGGNKNAGTFYVNGFPVYFDTSLPEFTADLNGLVYDGKNVITIIPDTAFEMVALDIFLDRELT